MLALVRKGISLNSVDHFGYTALHHAVLSKSLQCALMCLPRESPLGEMTAVSHKARDKHTALHIAVKLGLSTMVHAIVDYSAWMVCSWPAYAAIDIPD